jgi:outer membrane receptor protein involved in Fe transport
LPALSLAAAAAGFAQTNRPESANAGAGAGAAAGETVVLSPFEVTTRNDDGYIARNTLGASGMNVAVKDLPQSIEIITSEMIADLGAVLLDEVLRTSAAYTPFENDVGGISAPVIRGFYNNFTLRDGFRVRNGNSDTFNMDRVEIVKGAAAVLYGVSEPGGMVNYIVKKPQPRDFTRATFTAGSYDFNRGTLDLNRSWRTSAGRLSLRALGVWQDAGTPIPWAGNDSVFLSPKLRWQPFRRLQIDASYEYSKRHAFYAGRMPNRSIRVTLPDGTGANRTVLFPADTFDFGWDSNGPSAFLDTLSRTWTLGAEARLHRTTLLRFNLQQSEVHRDSFYRGGLATSTTAGDFSRYPGGVDPARGEYRTVDGAYEHIIATNRFSDFKIEALTSFDSWFAHHDLFYGWEQNRQDQLYNAIVFPTTDRVSGATRPVFVDWLRYVTLDEMAAILAFDEPTPSTEMEPRGLVSRTGAAYVMTRHSFWKNRLLVSVGVRFDEDNNGQELLGLDGLNYVGQYGAVFRLTRSISAYGLYNESFMPQAPMGHAGLQLPLADGSYDVPPATGLTREAGLKADFGKITFTAAAFVIRSGGRAMKKNKPGQAGVGADNFYTAIAGLDRSSGFEAATAATLFAGCQLTASYVQSHARVIDDAEYPQNNGKPLRSSPVHSAAAQGRYAFPDGPLKGLSLGLGCRYSGESQMELPDQTGVTDTKIRPSYITWNAFASYKTKAFARPVTLRITITNLFNKKYWLDRNHLADPLICRFGAETAF